MQLQQTRPLYTVDTASARASTDASRSPPVQAPVSPATTAAQTDLNTREGSIRPQVSAESSISQLDAKLRQLAARDPVLSSMLNQRASRTSKAN